MFILGLSHHTWWAILAVMINVGASIYYFGRVPVEKKIRLAKTLIGVFGGICVASLVFPLAGSTRVFAVSCVRGNGAACLIHLAAKVVLKKCSKTR